MAKTEIRPYIFSSATPRQNSFNQEYFSGADVHLEFEGVDVVALSGFQFQATEQMRPIYGYNSRRFDAVAIGNRIITGSFSIPVSLKDSMERILEEVSGALNTEFPNFTEEVEGISNVLPQTDTSSAQLEMPNDDDITDNPLLNVLTIARRNLGKKYVLGGNGPKTFDCSGFVLYCFKEAGIPLLNGDGTADDIMGSSRSGRIRMINKINVQPGDIGFKVKYGAGQGKAVHIGIATQPLGTEFIHASSSKEAVIQGAYNSFNVFGRYVPDEDMKPLSYEVTGPSFNYQPPGTMVDGIGLNSVKKLSPLSAEDYKTKNDDGLDITSINFPYIPHSSNIAIYRPYLLHGSLRYAPVDKVSRALIRQSYRHDLSIEELHSEAKAAGEAGCNIHFLVKKDGSIQQGTPICYYSGDHDIVSIMVEGHYDTDVFNINKASTPECICPPNAQVQAVIDLLNDLSETMVNLRTIMGAREYNVIYDNGDMLKETDPGYLFPMYKVASESRLNTIGAIADDFNTLIATRLKLDNIYDLSTYNSISILGDNQAYFKPAPADAWFLSLNGFVNVTSVYGAISAFRNNKPHRGIDYGVGGVAGTDIECPVAGTVVISKMETSNGKPSGFGHYIAVEDKNGNLHIFGHMVDHRTPVGTKVVPGQVIGQVGNSGHSSGVHLHYEVREGSMSGKSFDPNEYLTPVYGFPDEEVEERVVTLGEYTGPLIYTSPYQRGYQVSQMQTVLVQLGFYDGKIDGIYGPSMHSALEKLDDNLKYFGLKLFEDDGSVGKKGWDNTKSFISRMAGGQNLYVPNSANVALQISDEYDLPTIENPIPIEGSVTVSTPPQEGTAITQSDMVETIWGQSQLDSTEENFAPMLYKNRLLQVLGFDIKINYGYHDKPLVRELTGVYIRSVGQMIDTSGQPVSDVYEFIARDYK